MGLCNTLTQYSLVMTSNIYKDSYVVMCLKLSFHTSSKDIEVCWKKGTIMKRECRETHEVAPIVDNVTLFMNYYYYTLNSRVLGRLQRYAAIKSGDTSIVRVRIWEEAIIKKSRSLLQSARMI